MSSLLRRIQRAATRRKMYGGRGSRLGVNNLADKSLLARVEREAIRFETKKDI